MNMRWVDDCATVSEERFGLHWAGKAQTCCEVSKNGTATLRPCPEQSVNWNTTQNMYIEGDNLEVLKIMQKEYNNRVKMIYIDPPYNTGKTFVYRDNFIGDTVNSFKTTGKKNDGRYHSNWLNMMYPRLLIARNLLTDDGVIFISIDDNEAHHLRVICNEIFGEENFVAVLVWRKKAGGANDAKDIAVEHEYIICYKKMNNGINKIPLGEKRIKEYRYADEKEATHGKYVLKNLNDKSLGDNAGLHFDIECPDGTFLLGVDNQWKCNQKTYCKRLSENRIVFKKGQNEEWKVYYKMYLNEERGKLKFDDNGNTVNKGQNISSMLLTPLNRDGKNEIRKLFSSDLFSYPKPVELVKKLIQASTDKNSLVLDFFSGSATTAHAVMQLNAEDGGNRKFIMVQLPESTPENSEAKKAGYINICEIGKERIRRAGEKIFHELTKSSLFAGTASKLDFGFKVFKLKNI